MKNRVKELRMKSKINQEKLARELGISQQTLSRIENDKTTIDSDTLITLCKFFNVSIDYILNMTNSKYIFEQKNEYKCQLKYVQF